MSSLSLSLSLPSADVQCPELPDDGNVVKVSDNGLQGWGKRMVFECIEGYSFSDNSERITRTCQKNGTWTGAAPVCLSKLTNQHS